LPQWGLTKELRRTDPWNIPEAWLKPSKVITDPVHGDIYLSRFEQALVDSPPFQRLRRIRQLGTVHLVYPGATHTRFSHALGALRVVQDLLDIILEQRNGRDPEHDLFAQWESTYEKDEFDRRVAETVVLARLGTLLHDVCHVAFGHTIEDDLKLLVPHDENPERFNDFWRHLGESGDRKRSSEVKEILKASNLKQALEAVILSKQSDTPADEQLKEMDKYPFVADLVTNTICADLLDYLPRDHAFTGLPVGLGQRFMTAFYVVPGPENEEERLYPERMALRISHHGRERQDISSELLKHLRYRYELQERAIVHHAKLAADSMLGKALELWCDGLWLEEVERFEGPELRRARKARADRGQLRLALTRDRDAQAVREVEREVKKKLEKRVRELGDDGLLEYLAGRFADGGRSVDPRAQALAEDLLNRRLYKRAAQARGRSDRKRIFDRFGLAEERRKLERKAAEYVGATEDKVVIWLPNPKMRLKTAEVLVDFGEGIAPFNKFSSRGEEIYRDHEELWTITVFVHDRLRRTGREPAILARLAELMGVEWDMHKPPGAKRPADWPLARAVAEIRHPRLDEGQVEELLKSPAAHEVVHRSSDLTFGDQKKDARKIITRFLREVGEGN
jgi:HD superfamily phosphohydrolase